MKVPLLITSSVIAYDVAVKLKDTNLRKIHALESIGKWLKLDPSLQIILCDGSNYNFAKDVEHHFPSANIECLYFDNDQVKVEKYGRGYGEGEIVKYAIIHSSHIKKIGAFAKCSSKLWVENFSECIKQWNGFILFSGFFENTYSLLKSSQLRNIDTRFYIINLAVYEHLFQNAHITMRSREGHGLEDSFYDIFMSKVHSACLLTIPPIIRGIGGGSGLYYRESYFKRLKNQLRLIILRRNSKLKHLFIKSSSI
jgi:hypothetical protein